MGMRVCASVVCAASMALLAPTPATTAAPSPSLILLYKFDTDTTTAIKDSSASTLTVRAGGFYGGCKNSQYWKSFDSTSVVPTDVWTHLAVTYNGSKLTIYINGRASGSTNITGTT